MKIRAMGAVIRNEQKKSRIFNQAGSEPTHSDTPSHAAVENITSKIMNRRSAHISLFAKRRRKVLPISLLMGNLTPNVEKSSDFLEAHAG